MDIWLNGVKNKNLPEQWKNFFKKKVRFMKTILSPLGSPRDVTLRITSAL